MYSVVLMMSLTGGMETPDFGRRSCRCSCSGYSSCSGSCHGGRRSRRCHGCCGGYSGCCGGYQGCCGGMPPAYRQPPGERVPPPKKVQAEDRATVVVNLPADARLTVGGRPTASTSAQRHFITPALPEGDSFYVLRAEIVRDGRTLTAEQRIAVRPGEETRVNFDFAPAGIALAP
jgi:uncharacterized protein (TIGR03000 family)